MTDTCPGMLSAAANTPMETTANVLVTLVAAPRRTSWFSRCSSGRRSRVAASGLDAEITRAAVLLVAKPGPLQRVPRRRTGLGLSAGEPTGLRAHAVFLSRTHRRAARRIHGKGPSPRHCRPHALTAVLLAH